MALLLVVLVVVVVVAAAAVRRTPPLLQALRRHTPVERDVWPDERRRSPPFFCSFVCFSCVEFVSFFCVECLFFFFRLLPVSPSFGCFLR